MKTEVGYKLVLAGMRVSIVAPVESTVRYWKHRWTMPVGGAGPLSVFKTIGDALRFGDSMILSGEWVLWEVLYRPTKRWRTECGRRCLLWSTDPVTGRIYGVIASELPRGTVRADAVKLVKRIRTDEIEKEFEG